MQLRYLAVAVVALAACTSTVGTAAGRATGTTSKPAATPRAPASNTNATAASTYADWPAYHGSRGRSGFASTMPAVRGPSRVVATKTLDGAVYASPIVVGARTIVATENDSVYAFTPGGTQLWRVHLGTPSPRSERDCGNIDPLGITGTPVYSPTSKLIYVSPELGAPPRHELVALSATTGRIMWVRNIDMAGVQTKAMQERGALTIEGGRVWVPFGGQVGDCGGYKGRLVSMALNGQGSRIRYTVPTAREAGIWAPPGPSVDTSGYVYPSVGNGASGPGDRYDHSDSVLKLDDFGRLVSSFSPSSWATDNAADLDLGSQGPALVGPWIFIAGKSGTGYVLRRSALGGIGGQVSSASVCTSFGGTAVLGSVVYVPCTDGVRAVRIDSTGHLHVLWHASSSITGSPVVGGGRVWSLDPGAGMLHALSPSTGASLASVHVGSTTRFATPALYGHLVLVPIQSGLAVVENG